MKKFIVILIGLLFVGCATSTYELVKPDGTKISVINKRPIFAAMNSSWAGDTGSLTSGSSTQLDQLMGMVLAAYAKYQTGGMSMPIPTAPVANPIAIPSIPSSITGQ